MSTPEYGEDFDWSKVIFIVVFSGLFAVGARLYGVIRYLKWAKSHRVVIESDGVSFQNLGSKTILPWDQVTSLKVKEKGGNVTNIILKTRSSGKIELKDYDNLKRLSEELKAIIDEKLWV
ncbi:hypothetical protein [Vibrio sp. 16]|uniref:hypothetical protein n=1 Tax=Vibrio sp. 16 TaxID=391586 RepID=UPI00018F3B4E|nr:hypothetical protein [Vibrio sp. 16]EED26942.1 hypothetical protein VPMS16_2264 [Vibrio sp. 16]CAK4074067.1 hypothetical protein VDT1_3190 [Vibrio sp. 16]